MPIQLDAPTIHSERLGGPPLGLEVGIALLGITVLATAKEVLESSIKVTKASVHSTLGHIVHPGELLAFDGVQLFLELVSRRLLASFVLTLPFCKPPVECKSRHARCLEKIPRLLWGRV
jgi:hypothetical protein